MWTYYDDDLSEWKPARFYGKDIDKSILPIKFSTDEKVKTSFYFFMIDLLSNLFETILGAEDLAVAYGKYHDRIQMPPIDQFLLKP